MNKSIVPYSREFDEQYLNDKNYLVLCSNRAEQYHQYFAEVGYVIDAALVCDGINVTSELPMVTLQFILDRHRNAVILLDDKLNQEIQNAVKTAIKGTSITLKRITSLIKECPNNPRECSTINMSIDAFGDVYPCPKARAKDRQKITNIFEKDSIQQLINFKPEFCICKNGYLKAARNPTCVKRIALEFGGRCSAYCTYCYQKFAYRCREKEMGARADAFEALERFLDGVDMQELCVAGGEVLAQEQSMDFLRRYKKKRPNIKFILKTNGFSTDKSVLGELFEEVTVSMNGFEQSSVSTIMGSKVNVEVIKAFCEEAVKNCSFTQIKFLLSPLCVNDFPAFLDWAIDIAPQEISVTKAMVYDTGVDNSFSGSSFKGLNNAYWNEILVRISAQARRVVAKKAPQLIDKIKFRFGLGTAELLGMELLVKK